MCLPVPINNKKVVSRPVIQENVRVERAVSSEEEKVTYKEVQVPVTQYKTIQVPVATQETKMVKVKSRERVLEST